MNQTVTLLARQGAQTTENTYRLPTGVTAEQLARKYLTVLGRLPGEEKRPDEDTIFSLRDNESGRELPADTVVSDYLDEDTGRFEIVHTDTAGLA
jgi:hypothetical protein